MIDPGPSTSDGIPSRANKPASVAKAGKVDLDQPNPAKVREQHGYVLACLDPHGVLNPGILVP